MTGHNNKDKLLIKDAWFPFHFHRAIQQLNAKIEQQEEKILLLEARINKLE